MKFSIKKDQDRSSTSITPGLLNNNGELYNNANWESIIKDYNVKSGKLNLDINFDETANKP